jgi:ketosteroid isomerase-like protein
MYESFKAGDIDAMLTGMTEDIEWQLPEIAGVPFSGKRQGHDSIREFFASVGEMQDVDEMELDTVIAQGDAVVVL